MSREFDEKVKKLLDEIKGILDNEQAKFRKIVGKRLLIIYTDKPSSEILNEFFTIVDYYLAQRYKLISLFPFANPAGKILSYWAILERPQSTRKKDLDEQEQSDDK